MDSSLVYCESQPSSNPNAISWTTTLLIPRLYCCSGNWRSGNRCSRLRWRNIRITAWRSEIACNCIFETACCWECRFLFVCGGINSSASLDCSYMRTSPLLRRRYLFSAKLLRFDCHCRLWLLNIWFGLKRGAFTRLYRYRLGGSEMRD